MLIHTMFIDIFATLLGGWWWVHCVQFIHEESQAYAKKGLIFDKWSKKSKLPLRSIFIIIESEPLTVHIVLNAL